MLSFDDLKINEILMEAQGCFVWGRQVKIIIIQHGKYVLIAVKNIELLILTSAVVTSEPGLEGKIYSLCRRERPLQAQKIKLL